MEQYQEKYFDEKFKGLHEKFDTFIVAQGSKNTEMCRDIKTNSDKISSMSKYVWIASGAFSVIIFLIKFIF